MKTRQGLIATIAIIAAAMMLTAGGWLLGWRQMWAFSHLIFLPTWLRWLLAGFILLAGIITLGAGPAGWEQRGKKSIRIITAIPWPLALIAWGAALWLLRENTWYGDALLKLELLRTHTLQTDPFVWKEPLDSVIAYSFAHLLARLGRPPRTAVALVSAASGVIYLIAVAAMARFMFDRRWQRWAFVAGMLTLGSSQLWFGHIENYSVVTAIATSAMALAIGYLHGRTRLWLVGLVSGLAVSIHPQAAFILPGLLALLRRKQWPRQMLTLGLSGLIAPLFTVGLMTGLGTPLPDMGQGYAGDKQLFWTPAQALAPSRLLEAANNLWLLTPLAPLWALGGLVAFSRRLLRRDRTFVYLTLVAASLLFYHFGFQNDWPRHRDWDLYAIVGPGVSAWGLYATLNLSQQARSHTWRRAIALGLFIAFIFSASWVGVNHHFTLIHPQPQMRAFYQRYKTLDLMTLLPRASVFPPNPICTEGDDCQRVAATQFSMPIANGAPPDIYATLPTIFAHAPATITFPPITIPRQGGLLWLSPGLDPQAWGWGGDGVTFSVIVSHNGQEQTLWARHLSPQNPADLGWQEALIPLEDYRGQQIILKLVTSPGPAGNDAADRAGWGAPWLLRGTLDNRFQK